MFTASFSMEEIRVLAEALDGYRKLQSFNYRATATTPDERREADRKLHIIDRLQTTNIGRPEQFSTETERPEDLPN